VQILDSVTCGDDYTAAATLSGVFASNGGYFNVSGADVYMRLEYGSFGDLSVTREVHVPPGNGLLYPGTSGVAFRNYTPGNFATVSAGISEHVEPAFALSASGAVNPVGSAAYYNVRAYGAKGDGVTNDASSIAAAAKAAGSTGIVYSPPGYTYLVDSVNITVANQPWDFTGSTIKVEAGGSGLTVNAAGVHLYRTVVDGNLAGGGLGSAVGWYSANGYAEDCQFNHAAQAGLYVINAGSSVTCVRCSATGNTLDGFIADAGAVLVTEDCKATLNFQHGFHTSPTAGVGCVIDGYAALNGVYGCRLQSVGGSAAGQSRVLRFVAYGNYASGLVLSDNANYWQVGEAFCSFAGIAAAAGSGGVVNPAATACELIGVVGNNVETVMGLGNPSYTLSLAAAVDNRIGLVQGDYTPGFNANPAVTVGSASVRNSIDTVLVRLATWAVDIGETAPGNENNDIGRIVAVECTFGALICSGGNDYNHVGEVVSRNSYTSDATLNGLVTLGGTYNIVDMVNHMVDSGSSPAYIVSFLSGSAGNLVRSLHDQYAYATGQVHDLGSNNCCAEQTATFADSGSIDFFAPGVWNVSVYDKTKGVQIGGGSFFCGQRTNALTTRDVIVGTTWTNAGGLTCTIAAVGTGTVGGVLRVTTAGASGDAIFVSYKRATVPAEAG